MQVSLQCKKGVGKRNILTFTCTCLFQQTRKSYSTNSGNSSFPQAKNLELDFTSFSFCAIFLVVFPKFLSSVFFAKCWALLTKPQITQETENWQPLCCQSQNKFQEQRVIKGLPNWSWRMWRPKFNSYTVGTPLVHHYSWLKGPPL